VVHPDERELVGGVCDSDRNSEVSAVLASGPNQLNFAALHVTEPSIPIGFSLTRIKGSHGQRYFSYYKVHAQNLLNGSYYPMFSFLFYGGLALTAFVHGTTAIPAYASLAGLSRDELEIFMRSTSSLPGASPPPGPSSDTSSKLVDNAAHPYQAPGPNDIRGPCPGISCCIPYMSG
jgi:hypothetical protein